MIRPSSSLDKFNREYLAKEKFSYPEALKIFEGLYQEAKTLGVIRSENVLDGLEADIRIARILEKSRHV
jgi:hypothetical protein